jgi:hypothetical protein
MDKSKLVFAAASAVAIGLSTPGLAHADADLNALLVGHWYGAALDDTGACGSAQGEFQFVSDGSYVYKSVYQNCSGFAVMGQYSADGNWLQLSTEQCNPPGPICGTPLDRTINVVTDDAIVLSGRQMYHRG